MKKVFAFIGSPLREKSNTYTLTRMLLDRLVEKDSNIEYDLLSSGHVNIQFCRGCWTCMTRGFCPLDRLDDMGILKEKMLQADFIILGSPVYIMHVSGQMKTFLDRLCAWFHIFKLAGKSGLTVATTAGQGLEIVHDYLASILGVLGVKAVTGLDTYGYCKMLNDPADAAKKVEKAADLIYPYVTGEKLQKSDDFLEECFQAIKNKVIFGAQGLPADYEYWEKNGMLELLSYAELLEKIR